MITLRLPSLVLLFHLLTSSAVSSHTINHVLDYMQQNVTNSDYPLAKFRKLHECMDKVSASPLSNFDLLSAMDAMFDGFVQWGIMNGTDGVDHPQPTTDGSDYWNQPQNYLERYPSRMTSDDTDLPGASNVFIMQPCNYNSNVAYYESMLALCRGDGKDSWSIPDDVRDLLAGSFGSLATGSAFFHGSGTQLGCRIDNAPIAHIAITAYQAAVSSLGADGVVASCLPTEQLEEAKNGTEIINSFVNIFQNNDVFEWDQMILDLNQYFQDDYKMAFAGIVTLNARMELPTKVGDVLLRFLCEVFGFDEDKTDFLFNDYDVRLQALLAERQELSSGDKRALLKRGLGVLLKIGYAMFWQEELFVGSWLYSSGANKLGAWLQPFFNVLADKLTSYDHDFTVKTGFRIYPDCQRCRGQEPHSKWHEEAAVGLSDLVYLTDDIDFLLRGGSLVGSEPSQGDVPSGKLVEFLEGPEADCMRRGFMQGLECVAKLWELTDILKRTSACAAAQDHGVDNEIRYCFKGPIANSHLKSLANCVVPESSREFDAVVFVSCAKKSLGGTFWALMDSLF